MAKVLTIKELRAMQEADLLREIADKRREVAKLKETVRSGSEKGSHLLKNAEKQLAQMLTAMNELRLKKPQEVIDNG